MSSTHPNPAARPNTPGSTPNSTRPGTPLPHPFEQPPFHHPQTLINLLHHAPTQQPAATPAVFQRRPLPLRNNVPHPPTHPHNHNHNLAHAHAPAPHYALSPLNPRHRARLVADALTPALPMPDDPTCPICLDPYAGRRGEKAADTDTAALPCGHVFDKACVSAWLREPPRNTCPVCRYEVWHEEDEEEEEEEEEEVDTRPLVFVPNVPVATLGAAARAAVRAALRGVPAGGVGAGGGGGNHAAGAGAADGAGGAGAAGAAGDQDTDDLDSVDFDHDAQPMGNVQPGLWIEDFPPGEGPVVHAEGSEIDEEEEREIDNIVNQALAMARGPLNMDGGNDALPVVVCPRMRIPSSAWRQVHWMPAERRLSVRAAVHRARYGPSPREAVFAEAARLQARDDMLAAEGTVEMVLVDIPRMILSLMGDHNLRIRFRRIQDVINAMLREASYLDGREAVGGLMFNMMLRTARREIVRHRRERAGFRGRVRHWFGVRPVREITDMVEDNENDEMLADGLDVAAEMARRMINSLRVVRLATTGVAAAAGNQA